MKYVIALVASALIILAGILFVRQTYRSFNQYVRQTLKQQKLAGTLPPELNDVDIDAADQLPNMQMSLPHHWEIRLKSVMWIEDFWYLLAPLTVMICVGVAAVVGKRRAEP
jgi:hypothetical protein